MRSTDDPADVPARPDGVRLRARRSPKLLALGVLLACLGGLGAAALYTSVAHNQSVLILTDDVHRGELITSADVTTVTVGAMPGVNVVAADRLSEVVGQTAAIDLAPGSLLPSGAYGPQVLPQNHSQVGLKLSPGHIPISNLTTGTKVTLVEVPEEGSTPGRVVVAVVVSAPQLLSDGQSVVLDVAVPSADAPGIAMLAARDQLAVVREPD